MFEGKLQRIYGQIRFSGKLIKLLINRRFCNSSSIQYLSEKFQSELMADLFAMKVVVKYIKDQILTKPEGTESLPGLEAYTLKQQVWLTIANNLCTAPSVEENDALDSGFRVTGLMGHLKEFSEDFQCKVGMKMNPSIKCEVAI